MSGLCPVFQERIRRQPLVLRDWEERDLEPLAAWLGTGQLWRTTDAPYFPAMGKDEIPSYVARLRETIDSRDLPTPRTSLAIADGESGMLLGMVSRYWESKETNWPGAGIAIYDPLHWAQGLGYEALGLWTEYLFRTLLEIVRVDLSTWSGNRGMMRLAEKLEYQEEARFRRARIVNGAYYDGMGYGVPREEREECYPMGFASSLESYRCVSSKKRET